MNQPKNFWLQGGLMKLEFLKRNARGYTLVELAIVLVIIGLLLAGVLKGQQLIQNARVKNVMQQVDGIRAAVFGFYDKYGVFPGDENNPNLPSGDTHNGNGDGRISNSETDMLFEDLALSNYITGNYDGDGTDSLPKHAFGSNIWLYWTRPDNQSSYDHYFRLDNLPWDVALELDMKLDDGVYNTGTVRGNEDYTEANSPIQYLYIRL